MNGINDDDIRRATDELLAKMKQPLDAEGQAIAREALNRLNLLVIGGMTATPEQFAQIKTESRAIYATLASLGSTAAAELEDLFLQKIATVAASAIGRSLEFI